MVPCGLLAVGSCRCFSPFQQREVVSVQRGHLLATVRRILSPLTSHEADAGLGGTVHVSSFIITRFAARLARKVCQTKRRVPRPTRWPAACLHTNGVRKQTEWAQSSERRTVAASRSRHHTKTYTGDWGVWSSLFS